MFRRMVRPTHSPVHQQPQLPLLHAPYHREQPPGHTHTRLGDKATINDRGLTSGYTVCTLSTDWLWTTRATKPSETLVGSQKVTCLAAGPSTLAIGLAVRRMVSVAYFSHCYSPISVAIDIHRPSFSVLRSETAISSFNSPPARHFFLFSKRPTH